MFTDKKVKSIVGWIVILGHLGVIAFAYASLSPVLDGDALLSVLLVLAPVASTYFAAVVVSFIDERYSKAMPREVTNNFAFVAILLPAIFVLFLAWLFHEYPNGVADNVDSLQKWVAGTETLLGGTVGYLISALFPKSDN